jgi:hypothetical protein
MDDPISPAPDREYSHGRALAMIEQAGRPPMTRWRGFEVFTVSPEEFSALIKRDIVRLGKVVRESGARAE